MRAEPHQGHQQAAQRLADRLRTQGQRQRILPDQAMSRIIRTERLVLGPYRHKLIGLYIDWLNNKELMKYSEQRHIKHTISSQRHYLKSFDGENSFWWEINANSQPVGSITAFCDWPNKTA